MNQALIDNLTIAERVKFDIPVSADLAKDLEDELIAAEYEKNHAKEDLEHCQDLLSSTSTGLSNAIKSLNKALDQYVFSAEAKAALEYVRNDLERIAGGF